MHKRTVLNIVVFSFILLLQPGFNAIQQMQLRSSRFGIQQPKVAIPTSAIIPVGRTYDRPNVTAKSLIVIDQGSGAILYAKDPDVQNYPASLTKLMTALVALQIYPLDRVIEIGDESEAVGSSMHLEKGERITVQSLLQGLLISSGNDAAFALANNAPGGYEGFVRKMNETARALHMNHTIYKNVSGVEQVGHLTTVRDIATLTKEAMKLPFIQETVGTQAVTVQDVDGRFTHPLTTTNILLGKTQGIQGVKTGWTDDAGQCLITQTTRNQHTIITVVLNSQDRFGETEQLIEWAFRNHEWKFYLFEDWLKGITAGTYP